VENRAAPINKRRHKQDKNEGKPALWLISVASKATKSDKDGWSRVIALDPN